MPYSHILLAIALQAIATTAASSPRRRGTHSLKGLNDHVPRASFPALHFPPSPSEVSTCVHLWYGPPSSTHCWRARLSGCSRNCRRCIQGLRAGFVPSGQVAGRRCTQCSRAGIVPSGQIPDQLKSWELQLGLFSLRVYIWLAQR